MLNHLVKGVPRVQLFINVVLTIYDFSMKYVKTKRVD